MDSLANSEAEKSLVWSDPGSSKAGGSWALGSQLRTIILSDRSSSNSSLEVSPGKHKTPGNKDDLVAESGDKVPASDVDLEAGDK